MTLTDHMQLVEWGKDLPTVVAMARRASERRKPARFDNADNVDVR